MTQYFLGMLGQAGVDYSALEPEGGFKGWGAEICHWCTNWVGLDNLTGKDLSLVPDSFYQEIGEKFNIVDKLKNDFTGVGKYNIKSLSPNESWQLLTVQQMDEIAKSKNKSKEQLFNTGPYGFSDLGDVTIAGKLLRNDTPGNILYGYAAAAGGLSKEFVLMLAGLGNKQEWLARKYKENEASAPWYQWYKRQSEESIYNSYPYSWTGSYFDDPLDQQAISIGYDLWTNSPSQSITSERLAKFINNL